MVSFAILVAGLSSTVAALTVPLAQRAVGGVTICTGANKTGECTYKVYSLGDCHQLEAPYRDNTNTFAPDNDDFYCFLRPTGCNEVCTSPTGCASGQVDYNYEHKYNLSAIGWDTLLTSFDCSKKTSS